MGRRIFENLSVSGKQALLTTNFNGGDSIKVNRMAMQAANRLQKALRTERGLSFGAWQMLPGANHARLMARSGYDWICVDTEHGNIAGTFVDFVTRCYTYL